MRKGTRCKNRFDSEGVNPMNYLSNLSDVMLVLAVGIMLALIVHWNVDISTSGGTMSDTGMSYTAEGEGGAASIDTEDALTFTEDELEQMDSQQTIQPGGEGMEKLGEVYYDAATGQYYIVEGQAEEQDGTQEP